MSDSPKRAYRRRVALLERRVAHLEQRIADYRGHSDSYDRSEVAALRWALKVIDRHQDEAIEIIAKEKE